MVSVVSAIITINKTEDIHNTFINSNPHFTAALIHSTKRSSAIGSNTTDNPSHVETLKKILMQLYDLEESDVFVEVE